ncbi:muconolactone delta-isomerase [Sphingobium sp. JAI105]|uniref:muconolactone Delta-isomerase family protein n=1 Tax=Sphingobium sp. JAI105 TaxID=2787715 RepID=UPI0018CB6453|nr:muconolactone Delta-isomerase family protein [Sphingobium sp. JAI105]MBG6118491.1 muconolactone delta-isomerase [Sphingobium sp. JAI105]
MDFFVEMEIGFPPDYDPEKLAEITRKERERASEITAAGTFFKEVWIVPCQRSRILICTADDATQLHETFASLPAWRWSKLQATPLVECAVGASICIPD